ncbi:hypothetical protein LOK49_LG11G00536 [Camellia lanceoleosa]|uniref:Uncharacterized protein n=1 Tax=Camellia lanceoleosa TaxID=1840588 RepID=A0ACC0G2B3_9ERIC|nr:hypothetical protein LOK49_LG11G00536 [Camellia lanceoleosa]
MGPPPMSRPVSTAKSSGVMVISPVAEKWKELVVSHHLSARAANNVLLIRQ